MAEGKPPEGMTLGELRGIVLVVANHSFCRYWVDLERTPEGHSLMALCAVDENGDSRGLYEPDMLRRGFTKRVEEDGLVFWVVKRLDEDGEPYRPLLPPG